RELQRIDLPGAGVRFRDLPSVRYLQLFRGPRRPFKRGSVWLTAASISALFAGCLTTRPSHGTIEADHADAREQQRVPIVEAPLDRPTRPSPLLQAAFPLQTIVGLCEDYPEESRSIDAARRDFTYTRAA